MGFTSREVQAAQRPLLRSFTSGRLAGSNETADVLTVSDLLRAIVLGVTQGLTEFLPVSSSGHLILVSSLFGWEDQGLAFDVGLHVGTLMVLLGYFWRDWYLMVVSAVGDLLRRDRRVGLSSPTETLLLIALGSVPVAVTGLLCDDWIAANLREPWLVATMLALFGAVMLAVDRRSQGRRQKEDLRQSDVLFIGLAQVCALFPGVSRSGATMTAGLVRGLSREEAARFAFLLGTPAFAGAALLELPDFAGADKHWKLALVGAGVAGLVGLAAVHLLLGFLRQRSLFTFVIYRYSLAATVFGVIAARMISW